MTINAWLLDHQGRPVRGGSLIRGREGSIDVLKVSHGLRLPYDGDAAMISGTRKHSPLTIFKKIDQASPFFAKACCSGLNLKEIKLELYETNALGQEVCVYRYSLLNAKVCYVQPILTHVFYENISFIYEKITWVFVKGNHEYTDTWKER